MSIFGRRRSDQFQDVLASALKSSLTAATLVMQGRWGADAYEAAASGGRNWAWLEQHPRATELGDVPKGYVEACSKIIHGIQSNDAAEASAGAVTIVRHAQRVEAARAEKR